METNPEIDQDRVFDTVDHFNKFGCIMFPQQVAIYNNIGGEVGAYNNILEAGCGNGVGTAILEAHCRGRVVGTDKIENNCVFARQLYPWIMFESWDINQPTEIKSDVVVCIETIEHVANPKQAIKNLIDAATQEVWISTPNGNGKKRPPDNKYHVCEYTPGEMVEMIGLGWGENHTAGQVQVSVLHWKDLSSQPLTTEVDPLVYRIKL